METNSEKKNKKKTIRSLQLAAIGSFALHICCRPWIRELQNGEPSRRIIEISYCCCCCCSMILFIYCIQPFIESFYMMQWIIVVVVVLVVLVFHDKKTPVSKMRPWRSIAPTWPICSAPVGNSRQPVGPIETSQNNCCLVNWAITVFDHWSTTWPTLKTVLATKKEHKSNWLGQ